jgi:hypothetical protein
MTAEVLEMFFIERTGSRSYGCAGADYICDLCVRNPTESPDYLIPDPAGSFIIRFMIQIITEGT